MAAVDVVVVAHDSGPLLADAVARALRDDSVASLTVVDNASTDGSLTALDAIADSRLRIERIGRNAGFAVGCNHGARIGIAPVLAFLNPDALVEPDSLTRMAGIAAADPGIGLLGADVRDVRGMREAAARRRDPSLSRLLATQFARWSGGARFAADGLELVPGDEPLSEVDATSGALMVLPRSVFRSVGGFDEAFFLHAEDLDLCRRVRGSGYRVVVANDVPVEHVQGASSRSRPYFVIWHKHRSLWRYLAKHDGLRAWTPRGVSALLLLALRALAQVAIQAFRPR
jgi:GT2 family glycosyltransferase